ncbi:uncharacterized protein BCR38DRAFT_429343 [Pseudomassariella vexata]|uniref:Uncharacterized protein n=1 Tax=Pseudomassariella vexata TaxID=1141098 RepID=A0A1Y2E3L1_9PEZI|nr:uncharacterized protein BCR38DRAFT_429343 [Pseudomassariella vexata]ORY66140.1 hypothetical protein BCR38DRAFT_429343 [Pseudomassariella vexata]
MHAGLKPELELQVVADAVKRSKSIVILTGAGISTNAGIPAVVKDVQLRVNISSTYEHF